jgi:hypothetical protein
MKPWAIVAIVFGVLLVLAGSGVGIYFAVRSKPELSERNGISAMFKQGDDLSIGPRRCYVTTGRIEGKNISLAEAQQQCLGLKALSYTDKREPLPCVGVEKDINKTSGWKPCLTVWKGTQWQPGETYIIEDRVNESNDQCGMQDCEINKTG